MALKTTSIRIGADDLFKLLKDKFNLPAAEFEVDISQTQDPKADFRDNIPILKLESITIITKEKI